MISRRLLLVALALGLLASRTVTHAGKQAVTPAARLADHVILISIDGFRPAMYRDPAREGLNLPTLTALRDAGSFAEGVQVSHPSMTYPSHTSMATGVAPAPRVAPDSRAPPPASRPTAAGVGPLAEVS